MPINGHHKGDILRILIFMAFLYTSTWASENQLDLSINAQKLSIKPKNNEGHLILLNDKLVQFIPVHSRRDISSASSAISDFGLDSDQRKLLNEYLLEHFNSTLESPSSDDLIKTAMALSDESMNIMSRELEEDCNKDKSIPEQKKKPSKKEIVYCECELSKEIAKELGTNEIVPSFEDSYVDNYSFFGDIEKVSLGIDTNNDNHLHGLWGRMNGAENDGNDRGRTFGVNLNLDIIGEQAELQLDYESMLFTQLQETSPGSGYYYVDGEGNYYQDQLERNTLDMKLLKRVGDGSIFAIGGFELEQLTDNGSVAGPLQDAWHGLFEENNVIQYNNRDFMDDELDLSIYGGVGKEWLSDLGNWKCRSRVEGTVGINILDTDESFVKTRGEILLNSNKVFSGSEDNPWFLVSLWGEGLVGSQGEKDYGAGVKVSSPINFNKWTIEPSVGISMTSEKEDRIFSQEQSLELEPQSHIGITFSRKF